ncbi:MAG TPA: helix-turn-helix transcriptional regulator, partial [Steroidobacteraceae bacterium]
MIELRYSLGRALRAERKRRRMTQRQLALIMGADQATISRVERASAGVSLDQVIWAFLALDLTDEKIAEAINAGLYHGVKWLRRRMALKFE